MAEVNGSASSEKAGTPSPPGTPPAEGGSPESVSRGVPRALATGMRLEKVDRSGTTLSRFVQLDARRGVVVVETKKGLLRGITNRESVKYIEIKNIKEVRAGLNTKEFTQVPRSASGTELEDRAFSIIYTRRGQYKSLNLIAPTASIAHEWVGTLLHFWVASGREPSRQKDAFLRTVWNAADLDKDDRLSVNELNRLIEKFNISKSNREVYEALRSVNITTGQYLDYDQFRKFYSALCRRPDIERLFQLASEKASHLDLEHFKVFVQDTQKQALSDDKVSLIYTSWADDALGISLEAFAEFLLSSPGTVFDQDRRPICQDMSRPFYEYWISSSHNTYLLGDQLRSLSSPEGYIRALQAGCRCVEIDTWDGPNGQPIVTHGRTLTSKIPLREVLQAIAKYAFVASEYPLVLSFEQHCSLEQQVVAAKMLVEIFAETLVTEPVWNGPVPTLKDLKGRVILKVGLVDESMANENDCLTVLLCPFKHKKISINSRSSFSRTTRSLSPSSRTPEQVPSPPPEPEDASIPDISTLDLMSDSESEAEFPSNETVLHAGKRKKLRPTAKELSDLVILCVPNYLGRLPDCLGDARPECVTALSELTALRLAKEQWSAFSALNMRQCTRVYPRKLRIDSSNFDPQIMWDAGVSMVALNWQTKDAAMQRNRALFAANGGSGYVLKPAYLRFFEENLLPQPPTKTWRLKIRLISAQHLPRPSEDSAAGPPTSPYVAIDIAGHQVRLLSPSERRMTPILGASTDDDDGEAAALAAATYYSHVVPNNGFDPSWDEVCSFVFQRPETAFLRFRVYHAEARGLDTLLGCYTIHLPNMLQGYRHIPLENESGEPIPFASLFSKLRLKPYVN